MGYNDGKLYFRVIRYSYPQSVKKSRLASSCTSHTKALPSLARIMQQTTSHNCGFFLYIPHMLISCLYILACFALTHSRTLKMRLLGASVDE